MFDDDLDLFYADFGVQVSRQSGAFRGLLDVADVVAYEAVTHGTHVLRFPGDGAGWHGARRPSRSAGRIPAHKDGWPGG